MKSTLKKVTMKINIDNESAVLKVNLALLDDIQKKIQTEEISNEEVMKNYDVLEEIRENSHEHFSGITKYKFPVFEASESTSVGNFRAEEVTVAVSEYIEKIPPKFAKGKRGSFPLFSQFYKLKEKRSAIFVYTSHSNFLIAVQCEVPWCVKGCSTWRVLGTAKTVTRVP